MVNIEITFDKDIGKTLNDLKARFGNLQPVMDRAATLMQKDVFDHFKDEKGSSGGWAPLKAATIKWKAKQGWSNPLRNTGRLRQSNYPSGGKDYAQIRNDTEYAGTHQFGTKTVPQREFLWVSPAALDRIGEMVLDYAAKAVK